MSDKRPSALDVGQFSPEFQLACLCCRVGNIERDQAQIARLLPLIDVPAFVDLVITRHRIGPLVHARLQQVDATLLPPGLMAPLAAEARRNAIKAMQAQRTLLLFERWFGEARIPWLAFKGCTTGLRYYGDAGLRHVNDHDVWVPAEHLAGARAVLSAHGLRWDPAETCWDLAQRGPRHRRFLMRHQFEESHRSAEHGKVELHWQLTDNPHLFRLQPEDLLQGGDRLATGGGTLPVMNDVDLLLYLCEHGGRHCWYRLKWLADLPQLLHHRAWDWPVVLQRAEAAGCTRSLLLGLALARDLFGWPVPAELAQRLHPSLAQRMLCSTVAMGLAAPANWWSEPHALPLRWHARWTLNRLLLLSHWRAGVDVLWRISLNPQDLRVLALPDRLFGLYRLLRPLLRGVRLWQVSRASRT